MNGVRPSEHYTVLRQMEDDEVSLTSLEIDFGSNKNKCWYLNQRKHGVIVGILVLVVVIIIIVVVATQVNKSSENEPTKQQPFKASVFAKAAVAADNEGCSSIGKNILIKDGNAVDAALATIFCSGLLHMHSCGIGGGGFLLFYNRTERKSYVYDYREEAPGFATEHMFKKNDTPFGGRSIAIPGNVKGLYHVWKKHGSLKWKEILQPTVDLAENGFTISKALGDTIKPERLENDPGFSSFLKKSDGTWYKTGDFLKVKDFAQTLKGLQENPEDFYNGTISKQIVQDVKDAGGNITEEDLANYKVKERQPLSLKLDERTFHFMPPPGSGAVVAMIMNILHGFGMSESSVSTNEKIVKTIHKIIEAFKFSFARRPFLADPDFSSNVSKAVTAMLNSTLASIYRQKIKLDGVYVNETFYGGYYAQPPDMFGTSHISVISEAGDAVSATDTINYGFGARVRSVRNGIIFNNEMDDFSSPGKSNLYGYPPVPANFIRPGKRPLSSMSPTIVTDKNGDVKMIAGASGGSRIITATAQSLIKKLYLGMELGEAIAQPRVHSQLIPNVVQYYRKKPIADFLRKGLTNLGHNVTLMNTFSVVQAIFVGSGEIHAVSDPRKGGKPDGY